MLGQIIEERYLIEAELGEGAMGRVYRARHIKVGRKVAIKVMHPELARVPTIVERFAREARVAARLNHTNVVGVLDVGLTAERMPLIVMELAAGRSLYQLIDGPMQPQRVVKLVRQLLLGLDHAHAAGLVHRDLKPDNILVESCPDGTEIPRIVDFGIAVCNTGNDPIANRRLTEANTVIGTPSYMAPEQAMAKELDHRVDLFALGVIMFEMLAGIPPFAGSGVDVAIANSAKDAPSIAERAGVVVDPLLEAYVRKLIARRAADRFQSAHDALIMLDLVDSDRIAAAKALSCTSISPTPVALHVPSSASQRPAGSTRPVTRVTRVEILTRPRPARRRALAAVALAAAAMTAIVGWTSNTGGLASAARLESSLASDNVTGLTIRGTASELAPPEVIVDGEPAVAAAPTPVRPQQVVLATSPQLTVDTPATPMDTDTASKLASRYVAVGRALRGASDDQWARYRLIRINDAMATESSRRAALAVLGDIERAIAR